jgi:hypothetical protein
MWVFQWHEDTFDLPKGAVLIAEGRAELGTTFISEVLPVRGAKVVGPLPDHLHTANTYTAAIHTTLPRAQGRSLLRSYRQRRAAASASRLEPARVLAESA